jgi:hypothetical protein
VLLDEDGAAAELVGTGSLGMLSLVSPRQLVAGTKALAKGNRQHNAGRRPYQLGATLVIGPGDDLRYSDFEDFAGDHAELDEVLSHL